MSLEIRRVNELKLNLVAIRCCCFKTTFHRTHSLTLFAMNDVSNLEMLDYELNKKHTVLFRYQMSEL